MAYSAPQLSHQRSPYHHAGNRRFITKGATYPCSSKTISLEDNLPPSDAPFFLAPPSLCNACAPPFSLWPSRFHTQMPLLLPSSLPPFHAHAPATPVNAPTCIILCGGAWPSYLPLLLLCLAILLPRRTGPPSRHPTQYAPCPPPLAFHPLFAHLAPPRALQRSAQRAPLQARGLHPVCPRKVGEQIPKAERARAPRGTCVGGTDWAKGANVRIKIAPQSLEPFSRVRGMSHIVQVHGLCRNCTCAVHALCARPDCEKPGTSQGCTPMRHVVCLQRWQQAPCFCIVSYKRAQALHQCGSPPPL